MDKYQETVVAKVETTETKDEQELAVNVNSLDEVAKGLTVSNNEEYERAGEIGTQIKNSMAQVKEFFAPMKKAANDAHKQICARENAMMQPLKEAEKILKNSMSEYLEKVEAERRKAEEELKRAAEAEIESKLNEAAEMEANGMKGDADAALQDVIVMDDITGGITIASDAPAAKGISSQTGYEIVEIDEDKVPVNVQGACIRPVDERAVMRLIKATNGKIQIEGIKYRKTINMRFQRG